MNIEYTLILADLPLEIDTPIAKVVLNKEPAEGDIVRVPVVDKFYVVLRKMLYQYSHLSTNFNTEYYLLVIEYLGESTGASVAYNGQKATQLTGANTYTIAANSSHKIQIVCMSGSGKLRIESVVLDISETFSTVLDSSQHVNVEVEIQTFAVEDTIIIIEQY